MSLFDEWLETFQGVLTQPSEFFESEDRRDGFGFSLKFALINLAISGVLTAGSVAIFGAAAGMNGGFGAGSTVALVAGTMILTPILGFIGLMISAGLIHIFVALLGGEEGYGETLSVLEYASAISPINAALQFIPLIGSLAGLVLGLYALYVQTKGLSTFQNLSTGRALAAILLPAIIIGAIVLAVVLVVLSASFAMLGA
jgi:hypothetical protein